MRVKPGTDGLQGRANSHPMTPVAVVQLSQAAGHLFSRPGHGGRVLIGKDTRLSGYMIENALVSGFVSVGMDVVLTGPLPTPAIGMLTRSLRADLGVMISASHRPFEDNGIKFFGPDGFMLCGAEESAIAHLMGREPALAAPDRIGRVTRMDGAAERYVEFAKRSFPAALGLGGLRVVVDAANGASSRVARQVFWELGAEVVALGCSPDGYNINDGCGASAPGLCRATVLEEEADLGVCLDGDGDRVVLIDEAGRRVDADQIIALIAERLDRAGRLRRRSVVATAGSNSGLERHLATLGIGLQRTGRGGGRLVERMREFGDNFGGDRSGHLVLTDYTTTGDGVIAALQVLAEMAECRRPASEVLRRFRPLPQAMRDVDVGPGARPLDCPVLREAIDRITRSHGETGRIEVRPLGRGSVIRILAEGEDSRKLQRVVEELSVLLEGNAHGAATARPGISPRTFAATVTL